MAVKKTAVAYTSKKCYKAIKAEGLIKTEKTFMIALMEKIAEPATSRRLSKSARIERGNVTRILYDLIKEGKVEISHNDHCPVTGRTVRYYKLVQDQQSHGHD